MIYLEFRNLIICNQIINDIIKNKEVIGLCGEEKKIKEFLYIVSGLNKSKNCLYNGKLVFNNYQYSKNRLFLDFKEIYTTTLRKDYIKDNLKEQFDIKFNDELFKKNINRLNVRNETSFDICYHFTNVGNTLVNYSLVNAIEIDNLIIANPTIYLEKEEVIKEFSLELTNKNRYNSIIIYPNDFSHFVNKFDKVILFTSDKIVFDSNISLIVMEDNIFKRNIVNYCNNHLVICYHDYSKEELKIFNKRRIRYKIISIYDIDKYRKGELSI